jgi:hypothetical protein
VRRFAGWEIPGPVTRTPVGFSSPEEAVTGFYDRVGALDLQGAIDTFAPGEDAIAWLAPLWMPDAQAAIDTGQSAGWSLAISGLTYETTGEGDNRTLKPASFTVEGAMPADFNSDSAGDTDLSVPTVASPQPFKIERADGCTTYTGAGAQSIFGFEPTAMVTEVDGGYKLCGPGDMIGGLGLLGLGAGFNELPAVSVAQHGGKWYVSPLGTMFASVVSNMHSIKDGSGLFDSPLGPIFYAGMSRASLASIVIGQSAASVDPSCLPALTIENDAVTGVIADPPPAAIRACVDAVFGSDPFVSSSSGTAVVEKTPLGTP